jgi:hypothetical protein
VTAVREEIECLLAALSDLMLECWRLLKTMVVRNDARFDSFHRKRQDFLSARFGYVALSRTSHEATIFTDNTMKLCQQLGAEMTKSSAMDLSQTCTVGQSLGLDV